MTRCSATCVTGKRCKKYACKDGLCSVHKVKETIECSICFEENIKNSKGAITLECEHVFCESCIHPWIIEKGKKSSCPCCRTEILDVYHRSACKWGLENNYIFASYVHHYDFMTLSEIDSLILMAHLCSSLISSTMISDTEFNELEYILKDDLNYYEIFKTLKESVFIECKLFLVKEFPEKPENMHKFIF